MNGSAWGGFWMCALLGGAVLLGLLVLGSLAILPAVLAVWLITARPALRRSWFGALSGAGAAAIFIAYLHRRGPGTVCWRTATASGCDQYMNPWPWLLAGVALVMVSVIAQARRTMQSSSRPMQRSDS